MINDRLFRNFWVKLDKFLGLVVVVSVFCLIFVVAHRAIFDLDIWLHLKTGELILKNRIIPSHDIFSFTLKAKPWVDHEWLFQVISYLVYSKWEAEGLIILQCCIILLSFWVLFLIGYRVIKSYLEVALFIFVAAYASTSRFNIRPDMFSLFFFVLYLYFLRFYIDKRRIWLLVPLQVIWTNFHGYFFLGPLLILLFIIAEFLRRKIKSLPGQWETEFALTDIANRRLKKIFLFILLACIINPAGLKGALYPFDIAKGLLLGRAQVFFRDIQELQSTLLVGKHLTNFGYYKLIIIFCFSLIVINFKRLKIVDMLLVLFFLPFSFTLRNMAFFSFLCFTIIISYLPQTISAISVNIRVETPLRNLLYLFRYGIAIALIVLFGQRINTILAQSYYDFDSKELKSPLFGIDYGRYPKKAVDFILDHSVSPNILNDFNAGAYLIGRAYPERKVFIDGRTELYGPEFFKKYSDLMKGDVSVFDEIIDKYRLETILLSTTSDFLYDIIKHIYRSPQWKLVFLDNSGIVFLKDSPSHQEIINRYKINLSNYPIPKADLKELGIKRIYPAPYVKFASLFNLWEENELVMAECREALRIMPNCAEAFHLMGKVYLRKKLFQEALENLRAATLFLPNNVDALVDLGACLRELKETKAALNALKGAIRFNKSYAPAYYQLGCVYLTMNNHTEAISFLNKAIRYDSKNPRYHFKLGEAFYEKSKRLKKSSYLTQAELELSKALELNSRYQNKELDKEIEDKLKEIRRIS
jgi:tetratricopeptide (TPR) repeat protein